MRLIYTGLAFMGLMTTLSAFTLAQAVSLANQIGDAAFQAEILFRLSAANAISSVSLTFFGFHFLVLAVAIWRSAHVPKWIAIAVSVAGPSYPICYIAHYIAPTLELGWLLAFALGELVFMVWVLVAGGGCRGRTHRAARAQGSD